MSKYFPSIFSHCSSYSPSMAAMPRGRAVHSCGLVTDPVHGPEVIVAGGYRDPDTVDIYSINTDSWREGNISKESNFKFWKYCKKCVH